MASKRRPANSGRWAVAEAGICSPNTWEKFTPPCSKTAPSRMTRVRPPPPSFSPGSRCHASSIIALGHLWLPIVGKSYLVAAVKSASLLVYRLSTPHSLLRRVIPVLTLVSCEHHEFRSVHDGHWSSLLLPQQSDCLAEP